MFERSTLPSTVSTEISGSLQHSLSRRWLNILQEMLWLPENFRQYLLLLAATLLVGAGMMAQVWLRVQIAEERYLLTKLTEQQQRIERENSEIIFAIANATSLRQIEQAALAQGYRPVTGRVYVRRDELPTLQFPAASSGPYAAEPPLAIHNLGSDWSTVAPVDGEARSSPLEELVSAVGRGLTAFAEWLLVHTQGASTTINETLTPSGSSVQ
ncbi:hypothetical protein [Caldilinea sp.]|jgi:hypothetical protein|uniref:hypothetical protein n=1 Tax=Caldilinea sp. TaxID=2293560 RepID=UPI00262A3266|nr:hypothetical protein [uncultured Caldilinea sp.]